MIWTASLWPYQPSQLEERCRFKGQFLTNRAMHAIVTFFFFFAASLLYLEPTRRKSYALCIRTFLICMYMYKFLADEWDNFDTPLKCHRKVRMHSTLCSNPAPADPSFEISFWELLSHSMKVLIMPLSPFAARDNQADFRILDERRNLWGKC